MTDHNHQTYVPGCFRCDLSREEACTWDGSEETQDQCTCPGRAGDEMQAETGVDGEGDA